MSENEWTPERIASDKAHLLSLPLACLSKSEQLFELDEIERLEKIHRDAVDQHNKQIEIALTSVSNLRGQVKELIESVNTLLDISLDDYVYFPRDDYSCAKPLIDLVAKIGGVND